MARIVFGGALSHSPLINVPHKSDHDRIARYRTAVNLLAQRLESAKPDVVLIFGPDHFRAFFYDLMPSIVVGVGRIEGWGDWDSPRGPFATHVALAGHVLERLLNDDFDPAFSYDLKVDHGITQPLQLLGLESIPVIPILINSAGAPLPSPARCFAVGRRVARAVLSFSEDLRVAVIGSGGLSHDPPIPSVDSDNPEIVKRAIHGKATGYAASRERETLLLANIDTLNARINSEWDRKVLDAFQSGKAEALAGSLTSESIFKDAGSGAQEIRNWMAVAGAFDDRPFEVLYYEPIPALVTGMGVICCDAKGE